MGLIQRERRDIFYKIAKALGYRSRSALKLLQIHEATGILQGISRAVDLCASPGGFSKVLTEFVPPHNADGSPNVLGIDLQLIVPFEGAEFWIRDITDRSLYTDILNRIGQVNLVLCDGSPDSLGTANEDIYYQMDLVLNALILGISILQEGGKFVSKVFRGKKIRLLIYIISQFFDSVRIFKPRVCRQSSCEAFVVCEGFRLPEALRSFPKSELYDKFWPFVESHKEVPSEFTFEFIPCGTLEYDADANYPEVDNDFEEKFKVKGDTPLQVIQLPTMPNYKVACELKKSNNLAKIHNVNE